MSKEKPNKKETEKVFKELYKIRIILEKLEEQIDTLYNNYY